MHDQTAQILGQILAQGGNGAQIVMMVLFWMLRGDLKDLKDKVSDNSQKVAELRGAAYRAHDKNNR